MSENRGGENNPANPSFISFLTLSPWNFNFSEMIISRFFPKTCLFNVCSMFVQCWFNVCAMFVQCLCNVKKFWAKLYFQFYLNATGVTEYRIQDTGYRIQDTGYRIQDSFKYGSKQKWTIHYYNVSRSEIRLYFKQECNARKGNCGCVYSVYILKPVLFGRNL